MIIHYCNYSSHNNIVLVCGKQTTPAWGPSSSSISAGFTNVKEVYRGEGDLFYTFSNKLYNCPDCNKAVNEKRKEKIT